MICETALIHVWMIKELIERTAGACNAIQPKAAIGCDGNLLDAAFSATGTCLVSRSSERRNRFTLARVGNMSDKNLDDAYELVDKAYQLNREAISVYDQLLSHFPRSALYNQRGILYSECGEYRKAIIDLTDGIGLCENDPDLYVNRGNAYLRSCAFEAAIDDYDRALSLAPDEKHALNGKAQALADLARIAEAICVWERAIELYPTFVNAHFNLGLLFYEEKRLEEALRCLNLAHHLEPQDAVVLRLRGDVYLALRNYLQALRDYELAVDSAPSDAHGYSRLAWVLSTCPDAQLRNGTLALGHATKACVLTDWKNPMCLESLAAACAEIGDFREAIRHQHEAIENYTSSLRQTAVKHLQVLQQSKALRD